VEGDLAWRLAGHGHDLNVARDGRAARHPLVSARFEPVGIGRVGPNGQPVAVAKRRRGSAVVAIREPHTRERLEEVDGAPAVLVRVRRVDQHGPSSVLTA
jgi:hypothetical protein